MIPGTSPEWTLGNGIMAHLYGRLFIETRNVRFRDKASEHLGRLAGNIAPDPLNPGRLEITELFMHVREGERYRYEANALDLNWSRAYVEMAASTMRDVVATDAMVRQSSFEIRYPKR